MNNPYINQYIKMTAALFPVMNQPEKRYLKKLKVMMEDHFDQPPASIEDISSQFGPPNEILAKYYKSADAEYLLTQIQKSRLWHKIYRCILAVVCTAAVIAAVVLWKDYIEYRTFVDNSIGYYYIEEIN